MAQPFRLYNTLSRQVEPFSPIQPGAVSLYVCGMTVYDHAHVGHARAMVVFDTFVRWLRARGWAVTFVRNFTDVDDKIIARAALRQISPAELAQQFIDEFHADCDQLGLAKPDVEPRVSTSMPSILAMIQSLIDQGHAYATDDGCVWFSVSSYPDYGSLSGQKPDAMQSSADVGSKRDAQDFALWKAAKPGEPTWDSPWGPGRPGWHIECSAMVAERFGKTIDIHGGGLDLVFPHHENEVAQSVCAHDAPYVRYWMHNGLLVLQKRTEDGLVSDAKMGKSLGNVVNIHDALARFPAEALRLFYLAAHYRSPLPWHDESLVDSLAMLARLYEAREVAESFEGDGDPDTVAAAVGPDAVELLAIARAFPAKFAGALDDDFNTANALGFAFELARSINRVGNAKKARARCGPIGRVAVDALKSLQAIGLLTATSDGFQADVKAKRLADLGIDRAEVDQLIVDRTAARNAKDWPAADAIRARLDTLGIVVMDRPDGAIDWRVKLAASAQA